MSDITEGIGSAIEGGLAGRAVEPAHGDGPQTDRERSTCLNCGSEPLGNFCQNCGQKSHVHRSLAAIGHDLLHGVLHLDGKFWNTLPLLLFKPGKLTRRYINGERAKFVSPMAMFLFSVFAMFAVFQALGITAPTDLQAEAQDQLEEYAKEERNRLRVEIQSIEDQLSDTSLSQSDRSQLEQGRDEALKKLQDAEIGETAVADWLQSNANGAIDNAQAVTNAQIERDRERLASLSEGSQEYQNLTEEIAIAERNASELQEFEEEAVQKLNLGEDGGPTITLEKSGVPFVDTMVDKWRTNPSLMLYKMQNNAYKFSWLLIPISVPFVWLMFAWKRRFKAYDHAIFVTYSIAFMSLLFVAASVMVAAGVPMPMVVVSTLLIPPIHLYKQLRGTYEIGRFGAVLRIMMLSIFIWIVIALFLQALLLLGAF